jgi:hypothetical protein
MYSQLQGKDERLLPLKLLLLLLQGLHLVFSVLVISMS